jgi:hypothetical protein
MLPVIETHPNRRDRIPLLRATKVHVGDLHFNDDHDDWICRSDHPTQQYIAWSLHCRNDGTSPQPLWISCSRLRPHPTTRLLPRLRETPLHGAPGRQILRMVRRYHLPASVWRRRHVGDGESSQDGKIRMSTWSGMSRKTSRTDRAALHLPLALADRSYPSVNIIPLLLCNFSPLGISCVGQPRSHSTPLC